MAVAVCDQIAPPVPVPVRAVDLDDIVQFTVAKTFFDLR